MLWLLGSTRAAWSLRAAFGLALLLLVAWRHGSVADAAWYVATVGTAVTIVGITATRFGRSVAVAALTTFVIAGAVLTWMAGFGIWSPFGGNETRVRLYAENPNLLAADLAVAGAALMVVRSGTRVVALTIPMVALGLVLTGSRVALAAFLVAGVSWFFIQPMRRRTRSWIIAALSLVVAGLGAVWWQVEQQQRTENLLAISATFDEVYWGERFADSIRIEATSKPGPLAGPNAERIIAVASEGDRLVLYAWAWGDTHALEAPYVASVWLRADEPQEVGLAVRSARTTCSVGTAWTRCVSPPWTGNGSAAAQFRLETSDPGGSFDVYAWGPQIEVGSEASPYAQKGGTVLPRHLLSRFDVQSTSLLDDSRVAAVRAGLTAFRDSAWWGWGRTEVASALRSVDDGLDRLHHAHNGLVDRWVAEGTVGIVAWTLIVASAIASVALRSGLRIVPLVLALVVANALDSTFFHAGSHLSTWIALGIAWSVSVRLGSDPMGRVDR